MLALSRRAVSIGAAAVMVAGCSGSQPPIVPPGAIPKSAVHAPGSRFANAARAPYKVVFSFGGEEGAEPRAGLIDVGGTLYGSAFEGGANNLGTIFQLTLSGVERVHSFSRIDGAYPSARLVAVNGLLYGTTWGGGTAHKGTVFSTDADGNERVVYSFTGGADGGRPAAPLLAIKEMPGKLYGTTVTGGAYCQPGCGTVFEVSRSGEHRIVHNFNGGNGSQPAGDLVHLNGLLYGTTVFGGKHDVGTIFEVSFSGKERVVHSFDGVDGRHPTAGLVEVNGVLYGTTKAGGEFDSGTIFSMHADGAFRILHSFGDVDGYPNANLIEVNGLLYGTTEGNPGFARFGFGAIFKIGLDGSGFTVLHKFGASSDGRYPRAGLLNARGILYGTTSGGGTAHKGTIFRWIL